MTVIVQLVLIPANSHSIFLVDVVQTLMVATVTAASPCGAPNCRSPTNCTDTGQSWCHQWNCRTRSVEELNTKSQHENRSIPAEGPRSNSWRSTGSIPLLANRTWPSTPTERITARRPPFDHFRSCATCGDKNLEPSRSQSKCSTF